jgi:trimeric autotransporter adhesin
MKTFYIKIATLIAVLASANSVFAQKGNVGIGTTKPDNSAILEINSQSKGLLIPRLSITQRAAIESPATGLLIYQIDSTPGFYYFEGGNWKPLSDIQSEKSIVAAGVNWSTDGNSAIVGDFLGTTNATPLVLKMNNVNSGLIDGFTGKTFLGYNAGLGNTASNVVAIGQGALAGTNTGIDNLAIGFQALNKNSGGIQNVGLGTNSLYNNNGGSNNVAIGAGTLFSNISGGNNTAIGFQALNKNTGNDNLAFGVNALYLNQIGFLNTAIGNGALQNNLTGSGNTAIGAQALQNSTGVGNLAIGVNSLLNLNSGGNNTAVGNYSGVNKNGSGNVYIGYEAGKVAASVSESNKLYIANSSTTQPTVYGDFNANFVSIGNNVTLAKRDAIASSGVYGLLVEKGILTEKIKVATMASSDWADYVFDENYKMLSLEEVEKFIIKNKHLPNVPSAEEMSKNGLDVVTSDSK